MSFSPRRERGSLCPNNALTPTEYAALDAWRQRHGTLVLTREPEPGRNLLRFMPAVVPLVETFDRATCSRLRFARRLREDGRLAE